MKIKLSPKVIIEELPNKDQIQNCLRLELIYDIRKLKALVESMQNGGIEVKENVKNKQCFSKKFNIAFRENEFEIISTENQKID